MKTCLQYDQYQETGVREECGVFGIYDFDGNDVAPSVYYGLCSLQHRGQESCGIVVSDTKGERGNISYHKDLGLVSEVFKPDTLSSLPRESGDRTCPLFYNRRIYQGECTASCLKLY